MKAVHNDVVLGASVAILAALGCWRAMSFGADARVFPLLVLAPAVPVGVLIALRGRARLSRGDNPPFFSNPRRFFLVACGMALALLALPRLGFLTTSAITIPALSFLLGYRRPIPVLVTTALFLAVVYVVFIRILSRPLPREIWASLVF